MEFKVKVKVVQLCLTLGNPMFYTVHGILQARILEVGSLSLLQGIFPIQGSNPDLPHCRWILYQLSHQGGPRILAWVAYPFCRGLPDPGIELGSPALQVNSLPAELPGKPFDCVDHNKLWEILKEMGIPDHLTYLLRNLHVGQEAT